MDNDSIVEEIKRNMARVWKKQDEVKVKSVQPNITTSVDKIIPNLTPVPLPLSKVQSPMSGKVKMWINMLIEYDLSSNMVQVLKGPWTKIASDSYAKKKPPKPPKVAKDEGVKKVIEI